MQFFREDSWLLALDFAAKGLDLAIRNCILDFLAGGLLLFCGRLGSRNKKFFFDFVAVGL
jgi:hypothetical protein